jgi:hypothetical protein
VNIVYVNDVLFSRASGELTHTVGFLNAMVKKGFDIKYLTYSANKHLLKEYGLSSDIDITYIGTFRNRWMARFFYVFILFFYILYKRDKSRGNEVFYIRETTLLFFMGKKTIFLEFNGLRFLEVGIGFNAFLVKIADTLNRLLYKRAFCNIAVSEGIKYYLENRMDLKNVRVINNGTNLVSTFIAPMTTEKKEIVFIGNLSIWQDFNFLIECIEIHKEEIMRKGILFKLYGDGTMKNSLLKSIALRELGDVVQHCGILKRDLIQPVLLGAVAGLLLDKRLYEGFFPFSPLKYFEYRSCGLPVLFLNRNQKMVREKLDSMCISDDKNFVNILEKILNGRNEVSFTVRTWDDVALDFCNIVYQDLSI